MAVIATVFTVAPLKITIRHSKGYVWVDPRSPRSLTVRPPQYKERNGIQKIDTFSHPSKPEKAAEPDFGAENVGRRCEVRTQGAGTQRGAVRFVGGIEGKTGVFVGVELDDPYGRNDGSAAGKSYFECAAKHGVFARPSSVTVGAFPSLDDELLSDSEDEI